MVCGTAPEDRIEELASGRSGTARKKASGGMCCLIHGSVEFGIRKDHLIVRTAPDIADRYLARDVISPFDDTERAIKGPITVDGSVREDPEELMTWINMGRDFALTQLAKKSHVRICVERV
ncbi:MAG: hypothetical protein PVJ01_05530 [Pseudomonadota bacterium]|jgi:hypothetical protein